ncbi:MAG: PEP-CTERM sorting domain-containing protein [Planctomycetota bacterium]|nr:MAG: PEP-CTERM sorting domain-containing protein [Planctomycetota bacterium]
MSANVVPEPGSVIALLSLGAMGLGVTFFRRRRNNA